MVRRLQFRLPDYDNPPTAGQRRDFAAACRFLRR
jgi:hypothetical protein